MWLPISLISPGSSQSPGPASGRPILRAAACLLVAMAPAMAQEPANELTNAPALYLQVGHASHNTDAPTLGITLPMGAWHRPLWNGELRAHWDLHLSRWHFDGRAGYNHSWVLGVVPTLRLRPEQGQAPWFWELGVGGTMANRRYLVNRRTFSTRFNFSTHLGLGLNLGTWRQHELLLSLQHVSNAGIKEPNPGLNFLRLRYALHF